jgi:hypothetical protein
LSQVISRVIAVVIAVGAPIAVRPLPRAEYRICRARLSSELRSGNNGVTL